MRRLLWLGGIATEVTTDSFAVLHAELLLSSQKGAFLLLGAIVCVLERLDGHREVAVGDCEVVAARLTIGIGLIVSGLVGFLGWDWLQRLANGSPQQLLVFILQNEVLKHFVSLFVRDPQPLLL